MKSSKEFDVSFMVVSDAMSLLEMSKQLGNSDNGSHDKSDIHPSGKQWGKTIWRMNSIKNSNESRSKSINEQLNEIRNKLKPSLVSDLVQKAHTRAIIDIAVHWDVNKIASFSVGLDEECIRTAIEYSASIEITSYPIVSHK